MSLYPAGTLSSHGRASVLGRGDRVGAVTGRRQLRLTVCGIAIVAIAVASIAEPPGTAEAIGYAIVLVVLGFLIAREMRAGGGT